MALAGLCLTLLAISSCSEAPSIAPAENASTRLAGLKSTSNLTIETGMNLAQINAVLAAASYGQTVYVQPGTYSINGKIKFKPGITLTKTGTTPVFDATAQANGLLEMYYTSSISDCIIKNIIFHNIRFKVSNAQNITFYNCVFDYGKRLANTDKKYLKDAYINFVQVENGKVNKCTFSRRIGHSGRGIYSSGSTNCRYTNNTFGDGGATGYFTTAINDNSNATFIGHNTIQRNATWVNTAETDHGLYCHSFDGLEIIDNTISGWPANASGGAVKARNGENLTIRDNTFSTSGILLYTYDHATQPFLKHAIIENNTINVAGPANDIYHGIGYWRNTTNGSEYSIRIANNNLPNGTIKVNFGSLVISDFNAENGGVFNNNMSTMDLKSGIAQSGNY